MSTFPQIGEPVVALNGEPLGTVTASRYPCFVLDTGEAELRLDDSSVYTVADVVTLVCLRDGLSGFVVPDRPTDATTGDLRAPAVGGEELEHRSEATLNASDRILRAAGALLDETERLRQWSERLGSEMRQIGSQPAPR